MDNQTESGKSPADLAIAKVAEIVRGLPDDVTLEQLQYIVREVAEAFDVTPEEIDGSVRDDADEAAKEAASESAQEAARAETDEVYLDHMHVHSTEAIEAALEPVREKARERQNEAYEEAYNKHYDEDYAEAYRDAYRTGLLEDEPLTEAEAQAVQQVQAAQYQLMAEINALGAQFKATLPGSAERAALKGRLDQLYRRQREMMESRLGAVEQARKLVQ